MLRDATRRRGSAHSLESLQHIPPGILLAASLATAMLVCCPLGRRQMLLELYDAARGLGLEEKLLSLLRARCRPVGGLHTLMAAHLPWLVASWMDAGLPLFAFPHRGSRRAASAPLCAPPPTPRQRTRHQLASNPRERQGAARRHWLAVLPCVLERPQAELPAAQRAPRTRARGEARQGDHRAVVPAPGAAGVEGDSSLSELSAAGCRCAR